MWWISVVKRCVLVGVCIGCFAVVSPVWAERSVIIQLSSLENFIQKVWRESPDIQAAQASVQVALSQMEGAEQPLYNPSLVLDAERSDVNTTLIGFNQTLDWNKRGAAQKEVANQQLLLARARLLQAKKTVAIETLNALANYVTAKQMHALGVRRTELMQGFIEMVKQRQLVGDMGALEGTLAQVSFSEALMQQAAINSQLSEAKARLQSVTGMVDYDWPSLPENMSPPPEKVHFEWLERLPELMILKYQMEIASAQVSVSDSYTEAAPTLGVRAGQSGSEVLLGVSLEIPLFIQNNFQSGVHSAEHEVTVAKQQYQVAYRRAQALIMGRLGRYKNTMNAWNVWLAQGKEAHHQQKVVLDKMWQAGELTATEYLIQVKQNIDTQKAATLLMGELWQAAIGWLDASGEVMAWVMPEQVDGLNEQ